MAVHVVAGGFRLRLLAGTLGYEKCGARRRAFSTPSPFEIAGSKDFEIVNLKISIAGCLAFAIFVAADAVLLYASWFTPVAGSAVILAALAGAAALNACLPRAAARPTS
jgi:hypothetical protein